MSKRKVVGPYGAEEWGLKVGSEGWGPTRWEAQHFALFFPLPTLVCVFLSSFWGLFVELVLRFECCFFLNLLEDCVFERRPQDKAT